MKHKKVSEPDLTVILIGTLLALSLIAAIVFNKCDKDNRPTHRNYLRTETED